MNKQNELIKSLDKLYTSCKDLLNRFDNLSEDDKNTYAKYVFPHIEYNTNMAINTLKEMTNYESWQSERYPNILPVSDADPDDELLREREERWVEEQAERQLREQEY